MVLRFRFFKKIWVVFFFVIIWILWIERNNRVFDNLLCGKSDLKNLIFLRMEWWIKGWGDEFFIFSEEIIRCPLILRWDGGLGKRYS